MANKTTADVVLAIRQHSNTVNRRVVTDSEVIARANEGLWELYDLIDGAHGTYFVKPYSFSLIGGYGANTYVLPSDFYRAKALDRAPDTSAMSSVPPLPSFAERNSPDRRCYDLEDVANIMIVPPTMAQGDYRLRYIPKCPQVGAATIVKSTNPPPPISSPLPIPTTSTIPTVITGRLLGNIADNQRDTFWQIKQAFVAGGWAVVQSYNAGGSLPSPGVDDWASYADLRGTGGGGVGNSWIVLQNPQYPMQVCFEIVVSGGWLEIGATVGPSGGFTGGTTGSRPHAPGEIPQIYSGYLWGTGAPTGNPQLYAVTWIAADGSYARFASIFAGHVRMFFQFDRLDGSPTGWTKNFLFGQFVWGNTDPAFVGARPTTIGFQTIFGSGGTFKTILTPGPDTVTSVESTLEWNVAGPVPDEVPVANGFSGQYKWVAPLGIIKRLGAASVNGFWGYVRDQWWTVPGVFTDCDTAGDSKDFIIFGQMMLQWNGTVPTLGAAGPTNYPSARWQGGLPR